MYLPTQQYGEITVIEESSEAQQLDQTATTHITVETDWFLQNLVSFSNDWGIEMGITLQVSGVLVSGTLISGAKYFDEFAEQFSGGFKEESELRVSFYKLISSYKNIYEVESQEANNRPAPEYIHLKNTKFFQPGQKAIPTNNGVLWRGRIREVGGFTLGSFSEG